MTTLVYFDVSGHWYNAQDPDTVVSGRITFYPRVPEGLVINLPNLGGNNTAVSFPPVQARIHRGQLEGLAPGHPPLQLLANSTPISTALTGLGIESGNLVYDVQFTQVLFGDTPQTVSNFAFEASTDTTPIDLTNPGLTRLTYLGPAGGGGPLVIGTPGTPGPPGAPGPSWWVGGVPGVLPATSGQHLTTQGGNTLDDGTGNVVLGGGTFAGTAAGLTGKSTPTGNLVGTTDAQALTHKDLSGTGNTFPTFNQSTTGNAATATRLATARTINGVAFDGTGNITVADSTKVPWSGGTAGILPATSGQPLTTQGGNTLDDGSGNVTVKGGTIDGVTIGGTTASPSVNAATLTNPAGGTSLSGSTQKPWLKQAGFFYGSLTGGGNFNQLVFNDQVVGDTNYIWGLKVWDNVAIPAIGLRGGIQGKVSVASAGANTQLQASYVGVYGRSETGVNLGGTGFGNVPSGAYPIGSLWGGWFYGATTSSAATYLQAVYGVEVDVSVVSGASLFSKVGVGIILADNDAARGTIEDAALLFCIQSTVSTTWRNGIQFGSEQGSVNTPSTTSHSWPFDNTSTIIRAASAGTGTNPANIGLDFTNVTFTDAAIKTGAAPIVLSQMASAPVAAGGEGRLYVASDGSLHYAGPTTDTEIAPA